MIVSGFSISITIGSRCSVISIMSEVVMYGIGDDIFIVGP